MKTRHLVFFLVFLLLATFPSQATKISKADLEATHILVGQVEDVEGFFGVNERGDQIILSRVRMKPEKWIKGEPEKTVEFIVEGGSVGDLALKVSDIPEFEKGQRLRLLLKKVYAEFKYEDSEIVETVRAKPAKPAVGCCKTYARWPLTLASYLINPAGADVDKAIAIRDIDAGAAAWNQRVNVLKNAGETTIARAAYDGQNIVFFSDTSSGGAIAVTYLWYNKRTKVMFEFDMYFFEAAWHFFGAGSACNQGFYYLTIATHEFGHAVGIDHNQCTSSIMYPYASYCRTNTVSAEDLNCLANLYK